MRVLVTGSRTWRHPAAVWAALDSITTTPITVVHGDCRTGADRAAAMWCHAHGATDERHPAEWHRYGTAAGPIRNAKMVAAGADICLAFVRGGSRGASLTARLASEAGIPLLYWTDDE